MKPSSSRTASAIKPSIPIISGRFNANPEKVFNDIVKAYDLLPYYDGHAMHISLGSEVQSRSIKVNKSKINKVIIALSKQNLIGEHQSIQVLSKQGLIKVRGAKQFIYDAEEIINNIQGKRKISRKGQFKKVVNRKSILPAAKKNDIVFKTFSLKYASAADVSYYQNGKEVVIPGVVTLLRNMVGDGSSLSGVSNSSVGLSQPDRHTVPGLRGQGLQQFEVNAGGKKDAQVRPANYTNTQKIGLNQSMVQASPSGRGSFVKIEAERNLNAVIVRDYADAMPLYESLIQQLDQEPQLVEIQVTIIDVDKNKLQDIGFDWSYNGSRNDARFGGGNVFDFQGENGGILLNTVIGDARQLFARIRALAENGSAKVVSQPQVITVSNLEAVLQNDQSFYVRVAGNEEVDLFNVSAGTSLRVLPNIVGDKSDPKIRLLVTIEDGVIVPNVSVDDIPVVERSSLSTQAIIYNGENLLLGGLVRESKSTNTSKVPVLGDVPVVGNLFKRTNENESRTERLFLISPRIVNNQRIDTPAPVGVRQKQLLTSVNTPNIGSQQENTWHGGFASHPFDKESYAGDDEYEEEPGN